MPPPSSAGIGDMNTHVGWGRRRVVQNPLQEHGSSLKGQDELSRSPRENLTVHALLVNRAHRIKIPVTKRRGLHQKSRVPTPARR
jgi:hypothetical protein